MLQRAGTKGDNGEKVQNTQLRLKRDSRRAEGQARDCCLSPALQDFIEHSALCEKR